VIKLPPAEGLALPANTLVVADTVGWLWAFRDRFAKTLGQPWVPVGVRGALDEPASSNQVAVLATYKSAG